MNEYDMGENVDETAIEAFGVLLRQAYCNGEAKGGSMDWNDVQAALNKAVEALGAPAAEFMQIAQSEEGFSDEPAVFFSPDASWEVRAAATLVYAYRYPEEVAWEDVDAAWEILLQADVERGAKPLR